ncbi:Ergothioneine biosynthesis protein 1 [Lasiodiplodia theobromae]|uniref:Ergothioneine biosynthesis protein 1 n=1 Tax=Lasiodiplodia theobromae TaxID=45133 RepID=A0A5N5DN77_9PEZI|nr:Ergothioneine biosynthesis protein 1 [Lasiodiplodia theobromae]
MAIDTLPDTGSGFVGALHKRFDSFSHVQRPAAASPIIDIRRDAGEVSLAAAISEGLRPAPGCEKTLPTLLLYDEAGLRLFEKITYLDEYYLTNAEIEVLEAYSDSIAEHIQPGSMIVELGSGNLRKVNILLQALERQKKDVDYFALDLSLPELERTLAQVPSQSYNHVTCHGLHGTYDDGMVWMKRPEIASRPKTVLWLGSSVGNFKRHEAGPFLHSITHSLQTGDKLLVGIDACKDSERVYHAYNDRHNVTHEFILNGLKNANRILGSEQFKPGEWEVIGEYDAQNGRHHAFVSPLKDVTVDGIRIRSGERLRIEESYKYSAEETRQLWETGQVAEGCKWTNKTGDYGLHLVSKPKVFWPLKPEQYAANPVPSMTDWEQLWSAWDAVTRDMLPEEELLDQPIKLRNACIFYLGHIPTFLDIHLSRATGRPGTDPKYYPQIFERGIDPDVDDPKQCHSHSEIPDSWPPVEEVLGFQDAVRRRVKGLYDSGEAGSNRRVSRAIWIGYEHEIMHLETLLYMLLQSDKTLPPPATVTPNFEQLANQAAREAVENEWFNIPASEISEGLDDPEDNDGPLRYFGWDNEKPRRKLNVGSFEAKARPITNGEYKDYLEQTKCSELPASWATSKSAPSVNGNGHANGALNGHSANERTPDEGKFDGVFVRTVYGRVPLKYALDWPVIASYNELAGCASWMGGRIPTMPEARSIYAYVERQKVLDANQPTTQRTIPAVNGHLVNNGVEETPPSRALSNHPNGASNTADSSPPNAHDLFTDLSGTNVAFKHWHPVPVTQNGGKLAGQGDMGGAWEWTSTVLEPHEGFKAMDLYPGYTADFFDGKHNVVLGGSWATHPRIAGRKTFVNWYQRNYLYCWATARIVRDI